MWPNRRCSNRSTRPAPEAAAVARLDVPHQRTGVRRHGRFLRDDVESRPPLRPVTLLSLLATIGLNVYLFLRVPKGFFRQQDNGRIQGSILADQAYQASLATEPILIAAALATVYIILAILYESYVHPITIISSLPAASVGAAAGADVHPHGP